MFANTGSLVSGGRTLIMNSNGPPGAAGDTDVILVNGCQGGGRIMYQNAGGALAELGSGGGGGQVPDPLNLVNDITSSTGDIVAVAGKVQAGDNLEAGTIGAPTVTINGVAGSVTASGNVTCATVGATAVDSTGAVRAGVVGQAAAVTLAATGAVSAIGDIVSSGGNVTAAGGGNVESSGDMRIGAAAATESILLDGNTAQVVIGRQNQGAGPGTGKLVTENIDIGRFGQTADTEIFSDAGGAGTQVRLTGTTAMSVLDATSQPLFGVQQTGAVFAAKPLFLQPGNFQMERYEVTKTNFEIQSGTVQGQSLFNSGSQGSTQWTRLSDSSAVSLPQGLYIMQIDQEANPPANCPITGFRAQMFYHNNGNSSLPIHNSLNVWATGSNLATAAQPGQPGTYILGSGRGAFGPEMHQFGGGLSVDNYCLFPSVSIPNPQVPTSLTITMTWVAPN